MKRTLIVAWAANQGRSRDLAAALGGTCLESPHSVRGRSLWRVVPRYMIEFVRSCASVARLPAGSTVVAVAPPNVVPLAVVPFARLLGHRTAIDLHSAAINEAPWRRMVWMLRTAARFAACVLVTNQRLLRDVPQLHRHSIELEDPVPIRMGALGGQPPAWLKLVPSRYVVFPASGAADEPLVEVAAAAAMLPEIPVVVTGESEVPGPLIGSGWLQQEEFDALVANAGAILALTTRNDTFQRAAAEALAMHVPVVATDSAILQRQVGRGGLLVKNEAAALAEAVREVLGDKRFSTAAAEQDRANRDRVEAQLANVKRALGLDG